MFVAGAGPVTLPDRGPGTRLLDDVGVAVPGEFDRCIGTPSAARGEASLSNR